MKFPVRLANQPYLLLTLTSLFWGGNAVVGRAVVHDIPPVALAQLRWLGAFVLLLPFAWRSMSRDLPVIRRHLWLIVGLSFASITVFNTLLYWALQYTTAINASLMQSSGPLLIGLWSFLLFRDPLTGRQVGGIAVSLLGVLVIISGGDPTRLAGLTLNAGDIAVIIAMVVYALFSTLLRKRPPMAPVSFAAVTIGIGAVLLLPLTLAEYASGARIAQLGAGDVGALGYVIVFPSVLAYLFFNRGVELIGANRAGPFFHLIPLFGTLLAVVFLGERPHLYHGVGALLIVGGVFVASHGATVMNRVAEERPRI